MAKLTALDAKTHGNLKIAKDSFVRFAKDQHLLAIRVTEVPRAIVDFPVLISRHQHDGSLALSVLTSFVAGKNMHIDGEQWMSSFRTSAMMTSPLFLMRNPDGSNVPVLGIDRESDIIVENDGHVLFDPKGKPSLWLDQQRKLLIEDSGNAVLTQRFLQDLNKLGLIREVSINVHFVDDQVSHISGLLMVNEDAFQTLSSEKLTELRDNGYLPAIYAMLFSVFQLNALILRHNRAGLKQIARINLEVAKDYQI